MASSSSPSSLLSLQSGAEFADWLSCFDEPGEVQGDGGEAKSTAAGAELRLLDSIIERDCQILQQFYAK